MANGSTALDAFKLKASYFFRSLFLRLDKKYIMLKNKLYQYGKENGTVPVHLHFGKQIYDKMVENKHLTAVINAETDERITYEELAQQSAGVALSLTRMGIRKGDVGCVCSERRFEVLASIVGIMCAGAAYTPMDPTYGAHPLLHRLKISRPRVMFCSRAAYVTHKSTFASVGSVERYIIYGDEKQEGTELFNDFITKNVDIHAFDAVPVDGWTDNAFIVYSSGTTGLPKGVPLTHMGFLINSQCIVPESYRGHQVLCTREWYFTYSIMFTTSCLQVCATIVYHSSSSQEDMLKAIEKYKVRGMQVVPSMIVEIIKSLILDNYDVSSVQWMTTTGTPIRKDEVEAIKKRMPHIEVKQAYGMSEAGAVCHELQAPLGCRPGSSGEPTVGMIVKVVDVDTREPLGPHQRGEVCVKGPSVMSGYLNNVNPNCKDAEGFFITGDVGYYDEDGYFYIVNRIKEMIKFNDITISPAEFETILLQHPAVRDAGVIGIPHPEYREVPIAFIVLQPGMTATEDELVQHLNSRVTHKMRLAGGVKFVDQLPRTNAKLNKPALMEILEKIL